jgi:DNA-binding response OmpR family regulator
MPKALVVEDDRSSMAALLELVEHEGFEARGAEGVGAAREMLEAGLPPAVVLCERIQKVPLKKRC